MARPANKAEPQALAETNFARLPDFIDSLPGGTKTGTHRLKDGIETVAEVMGRLHERHVVMERWYREGMAGKKPAYPAENREKYRGMEPGDITGLTKESHKKIMDIIKNHSDRELFTKKTCDWTGTTSLAHT